MRDKPIVYMAGCMDLQADGTMVFMAGLKLEELGYATIDEYDLPRAKGLTRREARRFAVAALQCCDIVCFVPGWETNPSAVWERAVAVRLGKFIAEYDDFVQRNEEMADFGKGTEE